MIRTSKLFAGVFALAITAAPAAFAQHGHGSTTAPAAAEAHGASEKTVQHAQGHGESAAGHGGDHGAAAGGHGGGHHGPGPINWTDTSNKKQPPYIALLINFALLVFLYYKFGKQPIADGLKKRREAVAKQIEEASRIKAEAEGRAKKYQAQLERLDEEAEQAKQAIRTTGEADRDRVLREADEKAARLERDADALLDAERRAAKRALYEEAVDAAVKRAEDLLKTKLTQQDHERLAEEFLAQLGKAPSVAPRGSAGTGGGGSQIATPMMKRGEP